jgi:hypothetical protein
MSHDSDATLEHLRRVVSFAECLGPHSMAVFEHHYHYLSFGSWILVAGNRHRRAQLTWDGKEFLLSCQVSDFQGSSAPASWRLFESKNPKGADHDEISRTSEDLVVRAIRDGAA